MGGRSVVKGKDVSRSVLDQTYEIFRGARRMMLIADIGPIEIITKGGDLRTRNILPRRVLDGRKRPFGRSDGVRFILPGLAAQAVIKDVARTGGALQNDGESGDQVRGA